MDYNNENEITCPTGKVCFKTKGEIKRYIDARNKRYGGDRFRFYYCTRCGCYHLTTNHVIETKMLMKSVSHYNRLQKKAEDCRILQINGII